jgi:ubiquinone/menaquinone biosynthesis C-methylase UbiE
MLKIELGGGPNPRDGYINIDLCESADLRLNLEAVGRDEIKFPWDDDSVEHVYSCHCLEHVEPYGGVLREICRVCKVDAIVEFRFPHWLHPMAMVAGHKHVISNHQVRLWDELPGMWFVKPKRLALTDTEYVPESTLPMVRSWFKHLTDDQIMQFIPNTCHEVWYTFKVAEWT